jgi:hypothetical protein
MVEANINQDLYIKKAAQQALASDLKIVVPDLSEVYDDGWDEIAEEPEFEKEITYRRFDYNYDNMTGDIDKSTYIDTQIYAEVQPLEITDKVVKTGEMREGDAEIFMPARITHDITGTHIAASFRPQIDDEIVFRGIRYKIGKITFERIGQHEIFADCMCTRLSNENPSQTWNDSYSQKYTKPGRGGKGWV